MFSQILAGFAASCAFAIIYRVPWPFVPAAGLVGAGGWAVALAATSLTSQEAAVFMGALAVALASELWARWARQPVILFLVPGIIPLVPGGSAYVTMLEFLQGNPGDGVQLLISTLLTAGAISFGIIIVSSFFRFFYRR